MKSIYFCHEHDIRRGSMDGNGPLMFLSCRSLVQKIRTQVKRVSFHARHDAVYA